jgi:hypothetical protein
MMGVEGRVAFMGKKRSACRVIVKKLWGKKPLGIPRRRWEDNIAMCLQEIRWNGID